MIKTKSYGNGVDIEKILLKGELAMPKLVKGATEVIEKDNIDNLNNQKSYDGSALKPLSAKYLEYKKKHYRSTDIFKGKEHKLINSVKSKVSGLKGEVYIDKSRDAIMGYLEDSGRKGFGFGDKTERKVNALSDKWVKENFG